MPSAFREIVVSNKLGLHARPAMQFVDLANQFQSDIVVRREGDAEVETVEADGKSVMQMLTLEAFAGTRLRISAEGPDAQPAVDKLVELFEQKFGEDE